MLNSSDVHALSPNMPLATEREKGAHLLRRFGLGASEAELDGLRGIGPPFTRRLLAAIARQGFKDWHDLMQRVSGMGPRIAQRLSDQGLRVNGQAYVPVRRLTD
mgnify:CR=1 FL=1